ncbi:MAG TPA: biotin--[acetyl-CoA-carboxylase] ligase [Syntrophales bacterium]|nr:biotin--[acetyl-CoA-carboxylase] ligase [Syntrophales bacterium]
MSTKDHILRYLKENKGNWVSGEFLSLKTNVSRSAVWKHMLRLKEEGYVIESSRKKGYVLLQSSDLLLVSEIQEGLRTRIFGKQEVFHHLETDSTNLRAKILADQGAPEGTLVVAESQAGGKGRKGRSWFSPAGKGLYASLILRPALPPTEAPRLTLLTAVAAAEALLALAPVPVRIKWPNDITVNGKKLAGILTQASTEVDVLDYVVVGLGVNVNIAEEEFPDDLRDSATSLLIETGATHPRIGMLRLYLEAFEEWYDRFRQSGFLPVLERWKELSDVIGRQVSVHVFNHRHTGEVLDVDPDGALILRDREGVLQKIVSGDIFSPTEVIGKG